MGVKIVRISQNKEGGGEYGQAVQRALLLFSVHPLLSRALPSSPDSPFLIVGL